MRVITGKLRGKEIVLPRNTRIRPATGYVREMLMSLFTPERLAAGTFLDLCAGSGLVGFEAISRGAPHVIFVEADPQTARQLKDNAKRFEVADQVTVLVGDARRALKRVEALIEERGEEAKLSAVFADPPYIAGLAKDIVDRISRSIEAGADSAFIEDALIIVRTIDTLKPGYKALDFLGDRPSGKGRVWVYRPTRPGAEPAVEAQGTEQQG
jgi:16S rRNA (guanine966-N2)-methyltransferase